VRENGVEGERSGRAGAREKGGEETGAG